MTSQAHKYRIVNFADVPAVDCPCGVARRAFDDFSEFPATVHVTEISIDAKLHYHKKLTETYYFLECAPDARMQLGDEFVPVAAGACIVIPPGVPHRAIGRMKVLIFVLPKFEVADEWVIENGGTP